jgi:hypothetical protein
VKGVRGRLVVVLGHPQRRQQGESIFFDRQALIAP